MKFGSLGPKCPTWLVASNSSYLLAVYPIVSDESVPKCSCKNESKQEFVRPRWPYDMRPSARAEKYIRDAGP